jgi:ribonuclease HI
MDEQGRRLASISRQIGRATNNQAEYHALIAALEKAIELGGRKVDICMDSELVIRQIKGQYRIKSSLLRPLYLEVGRLLGQFDGFTIKHVPRERNAGADRLANAAFD